MNSLNHKHCLLSMRQISSEPSLEFSKITWQLRSVKRAKMSRNKFDADKNQVQQVVVLNTVCSSMSSSKCTTLSLPHARFCYSSYETPIIGTNMSPYKQECVGGLYGSIVLFSVVSWVSVATWQVIDWRILLWFFKQHIFFKRRRFENILWMKWKTLFLRAVA